jgi:GGDEF domain-containing protein
MVMIIETPETDIELLTRRLKLNLKAHVDQKHKPYKLSLSLGLTRYSYDSPCSIDELIYKADKAMYEQKKKVGPYY